jgi:uncharacterized protein DUF5320
MPGFDRTGPQGMGPMTGGARGRCNPSGTGMAAGGYGYGRGMAYGRNFRGDFISGRGMRRGFAAGWYPRSVPAFTYPEASDELNMLKAQAEDMMGVLEEISRRISELEKSSE